MTERKPAAGEAHDQANAPEQGPWVAVSALAGASFAATFLATLFVFGTGGFRDEGDILLLPLGLIFVFAAAAVIVSVSHVKNGYVRGKLRVRPTHRRVALGAFVQAIIGGLIGGVAGYGLVFKYINWVLAPG